MTPRRYDYLVIALTCLAGAALVLAIALSGCGSALYLRDDGGPARWSTEPAPWTWDAIALNAASVALLACDLATTAIGPREGYYETNALARDHFAAFALSWIAAHAAVVAATHVLGLRWIRDGAPAGLGIAHGWACAGNVGKV